VTLPQLFVVIVLVVPLLLIVSNRMREDVGALLIALALGIAQALGMAVLGAANTPKDAVRAIDGFSQPVVITLLSLFIVTRGLDKTGVTRWIARRVLAFGGQSETRLIFLFTSATAILSLFMNNLAAGALLLPSAMDVARRTGIKPSKLLIPVAYGSLLGGSATYFTSANIIASDLLTTANPPQSPLHILDFTPTGGLMAIVGIAFVALFGKRFLPDRDPSPEQLVVRRTGSQLEDDYQLGERLWEVQVLSGSALVGKPLGETGIGGKLGLSVPAIWRGRQAIFNPQPDQVIQARDILLIIGREERVSQLAQQNCRIGRDSQNGHISERGVWLAEVLLRPHSQAEGKTLKELRFRDKYDFTGVALRRGERSYRTDVADLKLMWGDTLLLVGNPQKLKRLQNSADFIVLESDLSDQPIHVRGAIFSTAVVLAAVAASVAGFPVYLSTLAAALVIIVSGLLTMEEIYRSMEWRAIFLVAGMYSVSTALTNTGLAALVGQAMVSLVAPLGALGLAAGAYWLTAFLTQLMGGQVTTLVTGPIVISAAISAHISPQAIAVIAAIGCSASFFTPIAHPVNILMIGPANYKFSDFFHLGWRLTLVCFAVLMVGMALFWRLGV
jgi:di/tricarboxylate transporter